ncbi:hypothetical protein BU26DRAFT_566476 [Trematosphaeria pertusa]|uniref:Uncharacterized protein n=1 Tax=Trematosphaeria pertusa TaxID=390896 RepID=A0A6A6IDC2_9PLEO|nr:uncharacterized protein BU26DRAFT_566476 [Trematosphaeria pertusa]KAF2247503.1 hypothetical protein BU26DRAFT_566476 [Trematosphaeria pertusa]
MAKTQPPVCVGITGDICISCKQTVYDTKCGDPEAPATAPLYDLSCHSSDEFQCCNCLTKAWFNSAGDAVPCPWKFCRRDAGFAQLPNIHTINVDQELVEKTELLRLDKKTAENLIGIDAGDARVFLTQVYNFFEDHVLDPTALGGLPGQVTEALENSAIASLASNPFFQGLYNHFPWDDMSPRKYMLTPMELERDLLKILEQRLRNHVMENYGVALSSIGMCLDTEDGLKAATEMAKEQFVPVTTIYENWRSIVQTLVSVLCWRHLERLAGAEDESDTD